MNPKVATARALAAYIGQRSLRFATILAVVLITLATGIVATLAYNFSPWWWLLIIPFVLAGIVFAVLRWVLAKMIRHIYRHPFSRAQREKLDAFADKLMRLIEARSTPAPLFAIITLWDILRRRDATTLRSLIDDSTSLKNDFADLEKQFTT